MLLGVIVEINERKWLSEIAFFTAFDNAKPNKSVEGVASKTLLNDKKGKEVSRITLIDLSLYAHQAKIVNLDQSDGISFETAKMEV